MTPEATRQKRYRERSAEKVKRMRAALERIAFLCDADDVGAQRVDRNKLRQIALAAL